MTTKTLTKRINRVLALVLTIVALAVGQTVWGMQIFIHPQTGNNFTLEVEQTDGTEAIKAKIEEKIHIPSNQQHLYYNNTELEDGHTLSNYNIQAASTLNLIYDGWANLQERLTNSSTDANTPTVITLDEDIVAASTDSYLNIPAGHHVIIDLNGHKIDRNLTEAKSEGQVFYLKGYSNNTLPSSLTIRDSQGGGIITGGNVTGWNGGGAFFVTYSSTLTIEGGTITGNKSAQYGGGAITATNRSTVRMTGGSITGNVGNTINDESYYAAGAICLKEQSHFYLSGGSITGNLCGGHYKGQDNILYGKDGTGGIGFDSQHDYVNRVHLSGSYTLSGNLLGSYSNGTLTNSIPSDYLHTQNNVIVIEDAISPTAPAVITVSDNSKTQVLTSGWSNYMTTDPTTCFTLGSFYNTDGKVIGLRDNNLVIDTPLAALWHADDDHDGTTTDKAYIITTPKGLDLLASQVNGTDGYTANEFSGKFFKLGNDITYTHKAANEAGADTENNFTAIGTSSNQFKGTFDGCSKAISGIRINKGSVDYQGLFGYVGTGGTVKNVILTNAVITGHSNTGAIVGENGGSLITNYYHGCTVNSQTTNVGTSTGDVDQNNGARAVYTLTQNDGVTATATAAVNYNATDYYTAGTQVTLDYTGNVPEGFAVVYIVNGTQIDGNTFTMPDGDVTVTVTYKKAPIIIECIDADGIRIVNVSAIPLDNTMTTLEAGTYFVNSDVTFTGTVTMTGNVHLVLGDGCMMNIGSSENRINGMGISNSGANLYIYYQSARTGALNIYTTGNDNYGIQANAITTEGGNITVDTNGAGAHALYATNGDIYIKNGTITATATGTGANAITVDNGNFQYRGCTVTTSATNGYAICVKASNGRYNFIRRNENDCIIIGSTGLYYDNTTIVNFDGMFTDGTNIYSRTQLTGSDLGPLAGKTLRSVCGISLDGNGVFMDGDASNLTAEFSNNNYTSVSIPSNLTVKSVNLNRTFTVDKPATIMLPFSKSVSDISGATFYTFGGVTYNSTTDKWEATMNEVTGSIAANTPYLVMPSTTSITFNGGATLNTTGGGGQQTAQSGSNWTFKGTYEYREWYSNGAYADEIGKVYGFAGVERTDLNVEVGDFVKVAEGARIRPKSCYLLWNDTPNAAPAMNRASSATDELPQRITVRLVGANGEVTEVNEVIGVNGVIDDSWYTLDGRKLDKQPTTKGLYLHEGRKVVIK